MLNLPRKSRGGGGIRGLWLVNRRSKFFLFFFLSRRGDDNRNRPPPPPPPLGVSFFIDEKKCEMGRRKLYSGYFTATNESFTFDH